MTSAFEVLREPFPAEAVGKLPRVTCKDCGQSQSKNCAQHQKTRCADCGNYITTAHIHLDYVGHAAVTDRLLKADPEWTYELVRDPNGLPFTVQAGFSDPTAKFGIWIELHVAGTKTPGFGEGKNFKEAISDAIRNAAMRRGVALDLWSKEDLHSDDSAPGAGATPVRGGTTVGNGSSGSAQHQSPSSTGAAAPSTTFKAPEGAASETTADGTLNDAATVRVHFGKNAGKLLADLAPKQREWYAGDGWAERKTGEPTEEDWRVRRAARTLCGLNPDETDGPFGIPF